MDREASMLLDIISLLGEHGAEFDKNENWIRTANETPSEQFSKLFG